MGHVAIISVTTDVLGPRHVKRKGERQHQRVHHELSHDKPRQSQRVMHPHAFGMRAVSQFLVTRPLGEPEAHGAFAPETPVGTRSPLRSYAIL